jgi:predicted transcriptional regulator
MRRARRVLTTVAVTLAVVYLAICVEFLFFQKDYRPGLTQPEINRIAQSLRRAALVEPSGPAT